MMIMKAGDHDRMICDDDSDGDDDENNNDNYSNEIIIIIQFLTSFLASMFAPYSIRASSISR